MNPLAFSLLGSRRFLNRTVEDLRSGRSVVIGCPFQWADQLGHVIEDEANRRGHFVEKLRADPDYEPLELLLTAFEIGQGNSRSEGMAALLDCDDFLGKTVVLESVSSETWPAWRRFLSSYSEAGRRVPENRRTVFLVVLEGFTPSELPDNEVALATHVWDDVVSTQDVCSYAAHLLYDRHSQPVMRSLLASVIASYALWDLELVEELSRCTMDEIFAPDAVLTRIARRRGWTDSEEEPSWVLGTAGRLDGIKETHSAVLQLRGRHADLQQRLWRGQVPILLLLIEEIRNEIIQHLGQILKVPFTTDYRVINDRRDLEVGHIHNQIRCKDAPRWIKSTVQHLVNFRNALAHMEPVSADDLRASRILDGF